MDDEVRAAAEAIISDLDSVARDFDHYEYGLPWDDDIREQMISAIVTRLRPADDGAEPDEAWLQSVGGRSDSYGGWMFSNGRIAVTANAGMVRWLVASSLDDNETLWVPAPLNRRQVRQLFAGLGIALKEPPA